MVVAQKGNKVVQSTRDPLTQSTSVSSAETEADCLELCESTIGRREQIKAKF
jgi:hypothetical protein